MSHTCNTPINEFLYILVNSVLNVVNSLHKEPYLDDVD